MTTALSVAALVFGYVFVAVILERILLFFSENKEVGEEVFLAALWPVTGPVVIAGAVIAGMAWLAWHSTEAPAALVSRLEERRTLRQAERAKRLREAREILKAEGLDFTP